MLWLSVWRDLSETIFDPDNERVRVNGILGPAFGNLFMGTPGEKTSSDADSVDVDGSLGGRLG